MSKLSNKEIRERISKLHSKKENLVGRKEELLKNYLEVCENTDHKDLIELDKQIWYLELPADDCQSLVRARCLPTWRLAVSCCCSRVQRSFP